MQSFSYAVTLAEVAYRVRLAISDHVISRLYAAAILEIVGMVRRVGGSATILLLNTLLRVSLP